MSFGQIKLLSRITCGSCILKCLIVIIIQTQTVFLYIYIYIYIYITREGEKRCDTVYQRQIVQKYHVILIEQNYCFSLIILQKVLILTIPILQDVDIHSNDMQIE
jgi:hypothetical protein